MVISIRTIKKLMFEEIHKHYQAACENCHHSIQRAFIHRGYHDVILPKLDTAETEEDLRDILEMMDYRMSVSEWLESL
jgi:hypothetical protein